MNKILKIVSLIVGILVLIIIMMAVFRICPPEGPWPSPPWCSDNSVSQNSLHFNITNETTSNNQLKPIYGQNLTSIYRPNFQKGVTFGAMSWKEEDKKLVDENIKTLKEFNVKQVILIPDWFVFPDMDGTEIKPYYDSKTFPNPTGWITSTLTDDELNSIIKKLNHANIKVILKPHIDPIDFGMNPESSRGSLSPTNWTEFFNNYEKFILHYAELAQKDNISIFVVGTELDTVVRDMPNAKERWEDLIIKVRKIYSGKLTYSVGCFDNCYSPSQVPFWDSLDYIGFEPYFGLTNTNEPTLEEMKKAFDKKFEQYAKPLYIKYQKPILLTETNIYSKDGANKNPLGTVSDKPDYKEQADYYEAMFESISNKEWIHGIYWWGWYLGTTSPKWNKTNDLSDSFVRKPAGQVMKFWYSKIKN